MHILNQKYPTSISKSRPSPKLPKVGQPSKVNPRLEVEHFTPISNIAPLLSCPHCQQSMFLSQRTLKCSNNHCFDLAKQGYVNLLNTTQPKNADTTQMVQARADFLNSGAYQPIADAVLDNLQSCQTIADIGAGVGWYLSSWLQALPTAQGIALDISTSAAKKAARAHRRIAVLVADTWKRLPLQNQTVDAVTCLFAPRNIPEFHRVLAPGGILVVVTPNDKHLHQLRQQFNLLNIAADKLTDLHQQTASLFTSTTHREISYDLQLNSEQITHLIAMGPNAFHTDLAQIKHTPTQLHTVTVGVNVSCFQK